MNYVFHQLIAIIELALQRTWASLGSHAAIALGVLVATTTICSSIVYAEAVNDALLQDQLAQAHREARFDLLIRGKPRQLDVNHYREMDAFIRQQLPQQVRLPITRMVRHGWSKPLRVSLAHKPSTNQTETPPQVRFQFYSDIDLEAHVEIVSGRLPKGVRDPQGQVEVIAGQSLAAKLGLAPGDSFQVEDFTGAGRPKQVQAILTGIVRHQADSAAIAAANAGPLYAARFLDEALTVPEETFLNSIALTFVPGQIELTWAANYDETAIKITTVNQIIAGLNALRFDMSSQLQEAQLLTNLDSRLAEYRRSTFFLRALLLVLGLPVIGIALYYIIMAAQLMVENQRADIALLKSRGSSPGQLIGLILGQGTLIVCLAISLAPFLALPAAQLIGKASTFMVFDNPRLLPVTFRPGLFGYATLAGGLALGALLWPTLRAAKQTTVTYRARLYIRPGAQWQTIMHRYYLDSVLLLLGSWGYLILAQSGTIITQNDRGGLEINPLLLLTPIALVVGFAFLSLRFIPGLMHLLVRLAAQTDVAAPLFGLQQVARAPARYQGLILLLTFTLAVGLFTATVANTFNRNNNDQTRYAVGADLRTRAFDPVAATWYVPPLVDYRALPGVETITPVRRVRLVGRRAEIRAKGMLLAIDPASFAEVAWWRSDFSPSLTTLLAQLDQDERSILADETFVEQHRLRLGDTFEIDVEGEPVTFVLAGRLGYFPTLYPAEGSQLVTRLDYLEKLLATGPSEVWLRTQPQQHQQTVAALQAQADGLSHLVLIEDRREPATRPQDPLQTGLFGALSLGFIAASGLSSLGFLLYAYTSIRSRALQFAILRATGLSIQQLVGVLVAENLSLISLGLILGTTFGGGAGWLFTHFLQLSIIARQAAPPFLITPPWALIGRLYLALVIIFSLALIASVYLLRRMRIHSLLRLGEV